MKVTNRQARLMTASTQRTQLYVALFRPYELLVTTVKKDPTETRKIDAAKWRPVINIGPNRMLFLGETLVMDARDSWKYTFNNDRQDRATGYGKGRSLPQLDWSVWRVENADGRKINPNRVIRRQNEGWRAIQRFDLDKAGLYRVDVAISNDVITSRWVRVYDSRDDLPWSVTTVEGLNGTWGGGWTCSLRIQTNDLTVGEDQFRDYLGIGLYAEDIWTPDDDKTEVVEPIGWNRHDPRLVISGYVRNVGIESDSVTKTVSLEMETITGMMERSQAHKTAIWNAEGPDVQKDDNSDNVDAEDESNNKKNNKHNDNNTDAFGAILKKFRKVCVSDFAMYLLQLKTNLLEWHDFYAMWSDELADLESIAGQEGSILGNLQTVAENDWMVVGADPGNAILFAPDRQVTRDLKNKEGWEEQWPLVMTLTDDHLLAMSVKENLERNYKYVKLVATKTTDVAQAVDPGTDVKRRKKRKAKRKADRNQIEVSYPSQQPSLTKPGQWFVKTGLLHDSKRDVSGRAKDVYNAINLKWSASVRTGLNRAIKAGDYVRISTAPNGMWADKKFLVKSYSAEIDAGMGMWSATLELEESLDDFDR